ncbi:MAG: DivIVA domain-containing protein, partial [Actinomycetota bacterium]
MTMPFSRSDPGAPAQVADATFATSRRGFDQAEVRDFLQMVGAEMARLSERVRFLEREVEVAKTSPEVSARLDEETLTRLLGEETARVLTAARASAAEIREKAEQAAAELVREASDEANRVREETEADAARRRADAAADAEAELEMAKQQGREMVNEERAYRERVLSELSRRRDLARGQIEQLVHGRDRLVAAFESARVAAVDVMSDLEPLGEPDEYVDLSPTTGPVPVMVAREASRPLPTRTEPDAVGQSVEDPSPADESVEDPSSSAADADVLADDAAPVAEPVEAAVDTADVGAIERAADAASDGTVEQGDAVDHDDAVEQGDAVDHGDAAEQGDAAVEHAADDEVDGHDDLLDDAVDDVADAADAAEAEPTTDVDDGAAPDDVVVDLFARLRTATTSAPGDEPEDPIERETGDVIEPGILRASGYQVQTARNGSEGLNIAKELLP